MMAQMPDNTHLRLWQLVLGYAPDALRALLLIAAFWVLLAMARRVLNRAMERSHIGKDMQNLARRLLKYTILILAILSVASQMGIEVTSLVVGLGVIGLAVSLAAQETIQNIIAGVTIAVDQPFRQGDWIRLGDLHADVTDLRLRSTVLTTFENETIVIPNRNLANERIINYTLTEQLRVRVPVGIAYKEDIDAAREVLMSTIEGDDRVLEDPEPKVLVMELGDSSVDMELRFWVEDPAIMFPIRSEYLEKAKKALDRADIEIPFPHLQLFLEDSNGVARLEGSPERR